MTRREKVLQGMGVSGGTAAPNGRRSQIKQALGSNKPRGGAVMPAGYPGPRRFPSFGRAATPSARVPGRPRPTGKAGPQGERIGQGVPALRALKGAGGGLSGNYQPGLGKQLSQRVRSGAIGQGQAQTVARQRQLLQKAFGSDWRTQVFGKGGAKGISGPFAQRQVAAKRSAGLERAKRKLY